MSSTDDAFVGMAPAPPEPGGTAELPVVEPEELAGLGPDELTMEVRRVAPLADEPSRMVARYLFPTERFRGEWRRHYIDLATPVSVGIVTTAGLGLLTGYLATDVDLDLSGLAPETADWFDPAWLDLSWLHSGWLAVALVLVWLGILGWVAVRLAYWHFDRFILTNKRVMKVHGIIARQVAMMPLLRVTDMKYEQTPLGRMLNYGTFVLESAGQDQALREVPHLPHPNELYLRVVEEMYEPAAVEARMDQGGEPAADQQGDA